MTTADRIMHLIQPLAGILALTVLTIWGQVDSNVSVPIIATLSGASSLTGIYATYKNGNGPSTKAH